MLKVYIATYKMAIIYVGRIVYVKELNIFNEVLPRLLKHIENYCFCVSIFESTRYQ